MWNPAREGERESEKEKGYPRDVECGQHEVWKIAEL